MPEDTKIFKAKNKESGVLAASLDDAEVGSISLTPVPENAPGVIVMRPGTTDEEHIYYKYRDAGAGTVSGLTRDFTNLNGGAGRDHLNGASWETLQAAEYMNNLVSALIEGYLEEQVAFAYVGASSFTLLGDKTAFYTAGRILRYNQDNTKIGVVASSSYNGGTGLTTVTTNYGTVPSPLTKVERAVAPKAATGFYALVSSLQNNSYGFAADSGGSDAYAITLAPAITAYTTGMVIFFKANTANTGAATLNANGLGAKTIKKRGTVDLTDNDIIAGQFVAVQYDGTNLQLLTGVATQLIDSNGNEVIKTVATASAVNDITVTNAATGGIPKIEASGDDANVDLKIGGKGTGRALIKGGMTALGIATEFTTTSLTLVDVTNWTTGATIVLKEASDVEITVVATYSRNTVGASGANQYQIKRDAVSVGPLIYSSVGANNQYVSFKYTDINVAAGTYTYKLQMAVASGTGTHGAGQFLVKVRSTGV